MVGGAYLSGVLIWYTSSGILNFDDLPIWLVWLTVYRNDTDYYY